MDKFFSVFGKVAFILIILGGIAYGGFYFGVRTKRVEKSVGIDTGNTINTANGKSPTTPTPTQEALVATKGGIAKAAGLSYDQYILQASSKWLVKKENQTQLDEKLTLTNDGYQISIFQAATGGALCLYPGDPNFEGPSSRFEVFKELTTKDGRTLRRSSNKNDLNFTICQKSQDGSYQQPTNYGHISIKMPTNWNQTTLDEIDTIISSIKKV